MKMFKRLIYIFLLVTSFSFALKNPVALTSEYSSIHDSILYLGSANENFKIFSLSFVDLSRQSSSQFGIKGNVSNANDYDVSAVISIAFYDENYKEIISHSESKNFVADSFETLNYLLRVDELEKDYSVSDIAYYTVSIDSVNELQISSDQINTPSAIKEYQSKEYVIDSYDVSIEVNENNTFDITETITAYFNIPKHGIYRKIPLRNTVTRLDGSSSTNRAQVTEVDVDSEYTASSSSGYYQIKIGSANKELTGKHTYVIKYKYNIGKDPLDNIDELYFNIIGTEWDTVIGNVTFKIKMPKDFDSSKLGFSSGLRGSLANENIDYEVKDNVITGKYKGILKAEEALTIRLELPEGYFVGAGLTRNIFDYLMYILPIVFATISAFLWIAFGRDEKPVETVEFNPPEGLNSLDVGYLYKGISDKKDVTSLLIYLANKGYIKITETGVDDKSRDFKITKLKDYNGNDENEKTFLEGLFESKRITKKENDKNSPIEVTSYDLYDKFYITMNKINVNVNSKKNREKVFTKKSSGKKKYIIIMLIITFIVITLPPLYYFSGLEMTIIGIMLPIVGFSLALSAILENNSAFSSKFLTILWGLFFGGIPWFFLILPTILEDTFYFWANFWGIIWIIIMILSLKYMPKRTEYGNEMLGKLRGFKNFLEVAEKDKLEALVIENPTYFYDILPYAYVLNVSDKWIKNFETISMQAPSWYDGPDAFDVMHFNRFMNSTMKSAQAAMSSRPSTSYSSSGGSGGGFSGGGSGGGGGGSW